MKADNPVRLNYSIPINLYNQDDNNNYIINMYEICNNNLCQRTFD